MIRDHALGNRLPHGPILGHVQLALAAVFALDPGDRLCHGVAALRNPTHLAESLFVERDQDLVGDNALLRLADDVARTHASAPSRDRLERPFLVLIEPGQLHAARQEEPMLVRQALQRILQSVEHAAEQAGA